MTPDEDTDYARLRWRVRRGMRELDQLLLGYLERRWRNAEPSERAAFERLLACEDTALWRWFLGYERPDDAELDTLVRHILAAAAA